MIIYYTKDFERVLIDSSQYIKLSKFILSSVSEMSVERLKNITSMGLGTINKSPTNGYYEAEGIILDSQLSLSIEIPSTDISIDNYRILIVYYENLLNPSEQPKPAFIISGSMVKRNDVVSFEKLNLEANRTIINILDFNPSCSINLIQDSDTEFLEGKSIGIIGNLFSNTEKDKEGIRYVSRESYEAYLLEERGTDELELEHSYTSYINNYGFKIY